MINAVHFIKLLFTSYMFTIFTWETSSHSLFSHTFRIPLHLCTHGYIFKMYFGKHKHTYTHTHSHRKCYLLYANQFLHNLPSNINIMYINFQLSMRYIYFLLHWSISMLLSFVKIIRKLGEILNSAFSLLICTCKHLMMDLI